MSGLQGKRFSITEQKNINTVIYQVNKTSEREILEDAPKFTMERLEFTEDLKDGVKRKTFFVDELKKEGNQFIILSFAKNRVVVNIGVLQNDRVKISKQPMPVKFTMLYSENETVSKEFKYTPNLKRPICIIDPVTAEEVKPILYFDKETNEPMGKIILQPQRTYFAFEIREDKNDRRQLPKLWIVGGECSINKLDKSYSLDIGSVLNFPEPTKELAKAVRDFTIIKDSTGNVITRFDEEKKIEWVKGKSGKIKARRRVREMEK